MQFAIQVSLQQLYIDGSEICYFTGLAFVSELYIPYIHYTLQLNELEIEFV